MEFTPLETSRLILRSLEQNDLADFLAYRSNAEVARYQYWEPFTLAQASKYIQAYKNNKPGIPGEWFQLGIVDKATNRLIGDCALKLDAVDPRNAEIGCNLAQDDQHKGLATEALTCLLDYAFRQLTVHRVAAITDCENVASVKLLERLKLRREGHFVKNVWFKGEWGSEYSYAILEEAWLGKNH
ncbi:MAG: acetyltransferase, ribosomal protein N-acetylase [Firmicutes bacterium]|nr:acetyltransferase, ribosomal protein N-acetylase [Bacillota bacterium]